MSHHHHHHSHQDNGQQDMTNTSYANDTNHQMIPDSVVITESTIFSVLTCFTIFCNAVILLSFILQPKLRIYVNYFVINLSFADFCVGLVNMTFQTYLTASRQLWVFGYISCHVVTFLTHFFLYGSVLTILFISFDRHRATYSPFVYFKHRSKRSAMIKIGCIWTLSFIVWFPFNLLWGLIDKGQSFPSKTCTAMYNTHHYSSIAAIVLGFWIPFPIIAITCCRIWCMIKSIKNIRRDKLGVGDQSIGKINVTAIEQEMRSISNGKNITSNIKTDCQESERETKKATFTLSLIVICYMICWLPYGILTPIISICTQHGQIYNFPEWISTAINWLIICQSLLNPFCYAVAQPLMKKTAKLIVACRFKKASGKVHGDMSSSSDGGKNIRKTTTTGESYVTKNYNERNI